MKAKRISNPFRKGNQAARKMQVRFFLSLMVLLALVFILDMVMSPGSVLGIYGFSGTTLAAMMVIGDVDDVSDRKTLQDLPGGCRPDKFRCTLSASKPAA